MSNNRTFVGFGFGPIQSGLFLYEAWRSGGFGRLVVAEIDEGLVRAVRANGGSYSLNIAYPDRVEGVTVPGVEIYNPRNEDQRSKLLEAVAQAQEMATALPSVQFFGSGGESSVAGLLAKGLAGRTKAGVIYTAENDNHAAQRLEEAVKGAGGTGTLTSVEAPPSPGHRPGGVQILNTVIGKMSGVITEGREIRRLGLVTIAPGMDKAILVEVFNRILISQIKLEGFERGIAAFVEKPDLLPFEEAKLYGHNAVHALLGYLGEQRGLVTMAQAAGHADLMARARQAFLEESRPAMLHRHGRLGDELFTAEGYEAYAEDLLVRMVNPNLNDLIARVTRDHPRKLGYDDRLFGTMRRVLEAGVRPMQMARGAAAAVRSLVRHRPDEADQTLPELPRRENEMNRPRFERLLKRLWAGKEDQWAGPMVDLVWEGWEHS